MRKAAGKPFQLTELTLQAGDVDKAHCCVAANFLDFTGLLPT